MSLPTDPALAAAEAANGSWSSSQPNVPRNGVLTISDGERSYEVAYTGGEFHAGIDHGTDPPAVTVARVYPDMTITIECRVRGLAGFRNAIGRVGYGARKAAMAIDRAARAMGVLVAGKAHPIFPDGLPIRLHERLAPGFSCRHRNPHAARMRAEVRHA